MGGVTDITAAKIRAGERPPLTLQDRNVPPPTYLSLNDDGTSFPIQQPLDLDLSSLEGFSLNPVNMRPDPLRPRLPRETQGSNIPDETRLTPVNMRPDPLRPVVLQEWHDDPDYPEILKVDPVSIQPALLRPAEPIVVDPTNTPDAITVTEEEILPNAPVPRVEMVPDSGPDNRPTTDGNHIFIDPNTNKGVVKNGENILLEFEVASGATSGARHGGKKYFTPVGNFRVDEKFPNIYSKKPHLEPLPGFSIDAPMPGPGYPDFRAAFHGSMGGESAIPGRVTHGCLRSADNNIRQLYSIVAVGTPVTIEHYRDRDTGRMIPTERRRLGLPEYNRRDLIVTPKGRWTRGHIKRK